MAFKATRMRDSIMDGQDKFIMRESDNAEVGVREDCDLSLIHISDPRDRTRSRMPSSA